MVIRPKQRGHVFTNIKTQQKPQPDSSKMKMTMSDADLKETVQAQSHNSHKAKSGPESDTVETVNEQLKVGGNKSDRKVNVEGAVMNETGNDDGVVTSQKETIHPVEEMSVDNNVKDITGDKSKSKAKTSGGMFDMDTNAIDNLETFGMETNWKTMMKGKGKQQLSVSGEIGKSFVKEKTGKGGISELEKLKSELKGLESRAKKETEKAHKLNITSPKGKVLSGTMSQSNDKAVKSTEPIAVTLNDSFNVTTIGSVDFMKKPADLNTNIDKVPAESLLEMTNTISDSMEISATSSNETKESISKHVLNLETVEKLTSSGLQLSSGINLRKRNSPAENVDVSLKKQVSIKDMSKKSVDDSSGSNISAKKYLLRDKAKTVSSGLKMNYQHEHRDEVSCDDDEEDDAGLVIDIPDMPKESDIASNIVIEKTPDSPPASPPASLPASPPASPPGSPPPMSIMDNPKSPGLETPVSPDKSHQSPMSAGLRNTCVIIPLGDDNEDHNVIDFSSKTPDLNIVKREIKIENNSHLEDTNTSNTQKSDVTNDVLKISENLFKGSVSRRSSLRSAGKILEEGNRSDVKEVVQNRRRTRQSLANEENKVDEIVQKSSFEAGTGEGNTDQADETGSLSKRQTDTMLKPGAIKENIR